MAPISRNGAMTAQNQHDADMSEEGAYDAPPSTMAAQLINNLSSTNKPSRQIEQDDLQKLMAEVSALENGPIGLGNSVANPEHKHKLIYVLACAVLERLGKDDPFMDVGQLVHQASEALDIFMSTIKELPQVLEHIAKPGSMLRARGGEPLWVWLFPRVLSLLGRRQCEALTEKIKDFFYVSFQAVSRSPKLWALSSSFFVYLKECVMTTLSQFEGPGRISEIMLPSDKLGFYLPFRPDSDTSTDLAFLQCTYVIHGAIESLCHASNVLLMLVDVSMEAASCYDATPAFQDYLAWILDSFLVLHELNKRRGLDLNSHHTCMKLDAMSLCAVNALLTSLRTFLSLAIQRKGYTLLSMLCADFLENPDELSDVSVRVSLSSALLNLAAICKQHDSMHRAVSLRLIPVVQSILANDDALMNVGTDFKRCATTLCQACDSKASGEIEAANSSTFDSTQLLAEFRGLGFPLEELKEQIAAQSAVKGRPSKRRKVEEGNDLLNEVSDELTALLGLQKAAGQISLGTAADGAFASLDDVDRCRVIEYLGYIPCVASGYIDVIREGGKIRSSKCLFCDGASLSKATEVDKYVCQATIVDAVLTLDGLLKSSEFLNSRKPRVLAMIALRKYALHSDDTAFLDLEISPLGQWCVNGFRSSTRELRVAASRTVPAFLRGTSTPSALTRKNRRIVMEVLRSLPGDGHTHLQETCPLAWGQLGRIVKDDELNIVLLSLVGYLAHTNPVVSGTAFNEVLRLAKTAGVTVDRLFSAFWGNIAIEAVKDLIVRPQTTQLMADLLGISVSQFLVLTQSYTLPFLVLNRNIDVIKRIAEARGQPRLDLVIMDHANIASILALLLTQNVPDVESLSKSLLKDFGPELKRLDLLDLLLFEPALLTVHLLKAIGDADDSKKSKIRFALNFVAQQSHMYFKGGNPKTKNPVGAFFEQHVLGIVANLSLVVSDLRDDYGTTEKKQSLKALEELAKVAKGHTSVARPQMCACVQAALAQEDLQALGFSAWNTLLRTFDDEDVETMLESTFVTVIQRWESFDEETQNLAEETLQYLLKNRTSLLRNMIVNLPSLSQFSRLADVEAQMKELRTPTDVGNTFRIFHRRLAHDNAGVVTQTLVEIKAYLQQHQSFLQASAVSEQPDILVGQLVRSILDTCIKFNEPPNEIAHLSAECLGLIGCLDPNRVEFVREQREMVVVSNFDDPGETTDFVLFALQEVIVPAFLSATDTTLQGFFSYVIQALLEKCDFRDVYEQVRESGVSPANEEVYQKWLNLPINIRNTLTPFLTSKYGLTDSAEIKHTYPLFRPDDSKTPPRLYANWLKSFVLDLLSKHCGFNADLIFPVLQRAIRIKDISVAEFLLPYVVLYVTIAGTDQHREEIGRELHDIICYEAPAKSQVRKDDLKLCTEAVFRILDYLARWLQEKDTRTSQSRGEYNVGHDAGIQRVNSILELIPPEIISRRAVECKSYSRALFYWEQHIRRVREVDQSLPTNTGLLKRLQDIYTQIDEPDGIEGISAHLHVLDIDQQIIGHRKAGRWTAAQSWYEIQLAERPEDVDIQLNLLTCLKASGQHDVLLNYIEGMHTPKDTISRLLPYATEASWATGRWATLEKYTSMTPESSGEDFNIGIGRALLALQKKDNASFSIGMKSLRGQVARSMSTATTSSFRACHDNMLKLHVLTELDMIAGTSDEVGVECFRVIQSLDRRIEVIGAYLDDKQYLLGLRRAAMELSSLEFTKGDIASAWLTSARLARKGDAMHQSFNSVLHAAQLGDDSATIEHARLLWKEGNHRKAIQSLQGAIDNNLFISHNNGAQATSFAGDNDSNQQNLLEARAHLLLAKWLDSAGQTQSSALRREYQIAAKTHSNWEKGHYYLGRHYNKLLESEKALPPEQQNEAYLTGETAKLVIECYLRSLLYGTKYIYQTLPRILTLWLDLGTQVNQPLDPKHGNSKDFLSKITQLRKSNLDQLHTRFNKYLQRLPAYIFYTALPQIVARIAHSNIEVLKVLQMIIHKVVLAFPQQALWSLLAVCTSTQVDRRTRGGTILQSLRSSKKAEPGVDIRAMIKNGERLTEQLLLACEAGEFQGNRTIWATLTKDLGFNHKVCMPSLLAVPVETVLTAALPTLTDNLKGHRAFSRDVVTIQSFMDEVMVLSSLQKPRKLTARGSDGRKYGLMCKPKDDLRKDQRLMEFNSMINRSLKRDAESSRRQLYIKTYAVTPLNEECGIIEWVDGLKTLRDILLKIYKNAGIQPNYREIEALCDESLKAPDKIPIYTEKVLGMFPPVFHLWFVQQFPEPSAWFAARLRYTRSCAVMSMVGTILGLGDRHGENILFEEGNGGTFHVDFNCLFDKGLTFVRPEKVPFRLTHNMVDAMGIYGYEGPFRKSSELTLKLLRQHQETLMTILEAFVYDPTLDLISKKPEKKRKEGQFVVPHSAQGVLDSINRKVRGLLQGESVPLGVEGQVDELIQAATNQRFLAGMYIGWCSFL